MTEHTFVRVELLVYRYFLQWSRENIEGFCYEAIPMSDRTILKDGGGNLLGYRVIHLRDTFHIRYDLYEQMQKYKGKTD